MTRSVPQRFLLFVTTLLLLPGAAPFVLGQHTEGRISVTVLDPQNAVIQGARLDLKDLATNEARTAATQTGGTFTFANLRPGKYTLTIAAPGFREAVYEAVVSGTKSTDI